MMLVGLATVHEAEHNDLVRKLQPRATDAQLKQLRNMMGEMKSHRRGIIERKGIQENLVSLNIRVASKGGNC